MVAGIFKWRAEKATPCAWFPESKYQYLGCIGTFQKLFLTCGTCNNALPPPLLGQMRHLVVRPAELETENWKQILPFKKHPAFVTIAEVYRMVKRCFIDHIVHARCQNQPQILELIVAPY